MDRSSSNGAEAKVVARRLHLPAIPAVGIGRLSIAVSLVSGPLPTHVLSIANQQI